MKDILKSKAKFATAFIIGWILYGIGHSASIFLRMPESFLWGIWIDPVYKIYNKCMIASCDIDDWGSSGIWKWTSYKYEEDLED